MTGPIPNDPKKSTIHHVETLQPSEGTQKSLAKISPDLLQNLTPKPPETSKIDQPTTILSDIPSTPPVELVNKIEEAIKAAEFLQNQDPTTSITEFIENNDSKIIEHLIRNLQEDPSKTFSQSEASFNTTQSIGNSFLSSLAFVSHEALDTMDFLGTQIRQDLFSQEAFFGLKGIETGVSIFKLIGAAGSAVIVQALINQVNKAIELKKELHNAMEDGPEKASLEREIGILTNWVKLHRYTLRDRIKDFVISTAFAFPKVGTAICAILEKGSTPVGVAFGGFNIGAGILSSTYEWYQAQKGIFKHEKWSEGLLNQQPKNKTLSTHAQELLKKQKEIHQNRLKRNLPRLQEKLAPIIQSLEAEEALPPEAQKTLLEASLKQLEDLGFNLAPESQSHVGTVPEINLKQVKTPGELRELLLNPQVQNQLNHQMSRKSESLSMSLRNALKTFMLKKADIESGFLNWELIKTKINIVAVGLISGLWIAVKVAAIGGLVTSLVASGYALLALSVVLAAAGLAYLYYKKPNVFKTMCKGVHIELALRKIPLAIQEYRRQSGLLDILNVAEQSQNIMSQMLALKQINENTTLDQMPQEFQAFLKEKEKKNTGFSSQEIETRKEEYYNHLNQQYGNYEKEMNELNTRVLQLNESFENQQKIIHELENQIEEAGWKDYQNSLYKNMLDEGWVKQQTELKTFQLPEEPTSIGELPGGLQTFMKHKFHAISEIEKQTLTPEEIKSGLQEYQAELEAKIQASKEKKEDIDFLTSFTLSELKNFQLPEEPTSIGELPGGLQTFMKHKFHAISEIEKQTLTPEEIKSGLQEYQAELEAKIQASKEKEEDVNILTSFILSDEGLLQDETIISILKQMDIDLEALRSIEPEKAKKQTAHLIQCFFTMDEQDLLKALRSYRRKLKIA